MVSASTFALGIVWDDWRQPGDTHSTRTFSVVTVPANNLMSTIHDRVPLILDRKDYARWLSIDEIDPAGLM